MKRWHSRRRSNHCGRKSNTARFIGVTSRTQEFRVISQSRIRGGELARLINPIFLAESWSGCIRAPRGTRAREIWKEATRTLGGVPQLEKRGNLCVTRKHMINIYPNANRNEEGLVRGEEGEVVGSKSGGCSVGSRIMGFSYFRPWMASRIAESRKWKNAARRRDGGSYQLPRLHLQRINEHTADDTTTRRRRELLAAFSRIHARENRWRNRRHSMPGWTRFSSISVPIFRIIPGRNLTPILQFLSTYNFDFNFCNCNHGMCWFRLSWYFPKILRCRILFIKLRINSAYIVKA